jgi:hypothetical protein
LSLLLSNARMYKASNWKRPLPNFKWLKSQHFNLVMNNINTIQTHSRAFQNLKLLTFFLYKNLRNVLRNEGQKFIHAPVKLSFLKRST